MGTQLPRADSMGSIFSALEAKVATQATSPTASYSNVQGGAFNVLDANGRITASFGKYTYLSGRWAGRTLAGSLVFFDALGSPTLVLGPQPDGKTGLGLYTPDGVRTVLLGTQADGVTGLGLFDLLGHLVSEMGPKGPKGLENFDTAGNPRSTVGLLPSGDYGLGVYPIGAGGTLQEVLPLTVGPTSALVSVGAAYTYVGGDVTTTVGASGTVLIRGTADLIMTTANVGVKGGIVIDGATGTIHAETVLSVSGGNTAQGTVTRAEKITGLTPGPHTFAYYAAATGAGTASVFGAVVEVQPI